jgi:hypothetical protein
MDRQFPPPPLIPDEGREINTPFFRLVNEFSPLFVVPLNFAPAMSLEECYSQRKVVLKIERLESLENQEVSINQIIKINVITV